MWVRAQRPFGLRVQDGGVVSFSLSLSLSFLSYVSLFFSVFSFPPPFSRCVGVLSVPSTCVYRGADL